jgi:hypothetical protein
VSGTFFLGTFRRRRGHCTRRDEIDGGSRGGQFLDGSGRNREGLRRPWELPRGIAPLMRTTTCESQVAHLARWRDLPILISTAVSSGSGVRCTPYK